MINITILENSNGNYKGLISEGHAGYAERGSDIVCASVSILIMNTINAIETYTRDAIEVESNQQEGYIGMRFVKPISEEATLLMDAMILGLSGIEDQYKKYVRILIEEV